MSRCKLFLLLPLLGFFAGCETITEPLQSGMSEVTGMFSHMTDSATGKSPRAAAVQMEDEYYPDQRRMGINRLVSDRFGQREPYTTRYAQVAQLDEDWLVRATAMRALNRSRDRTATPVFIKGLSDKNDRVRLEAAKGLANLPDDSGAAVEPLVKVVQNADEVGDVRIAAADALKHYRSLEAARALANALAGRDFGVAWQAHQTLTIMTGHDLNYDEAAWLAYLTGPEKPFG